MGWLTVALVSVTLLALGLYGFKRTEATLLEPPPSPGLGAPSMDHARAQIQESEWVKLAHQRRWPQDCTHLLPRGSRSRWRTRSGDLEITVLFEHGLDQAKEHPRFAIPCAPIPQGLLQNRRLIAEAMYWQGQSSERHFNGRWLPEMPGPQKAHWSPETRLAEELGTLELQVPARVEDLEAIRSGLDALRVALLQARRPAWSRLAHAKGWALHIDAASSEVRLDGTLDGVPFQAALRGGGRRWTTEVQSRTPCAPLDQLYIAHIDHPKDAAIPLHHPIARGRLHCAGASSSAVHALLDDPAVFGPLMAVLHGYPGSHLQQGRVTLVAPGNLTLGLDAAIQALADLSLALEAHPWSG